MRSWRWRNPRRLVTKSAGKFGHRPVEAVKSARGNMHSVDALHRRRGIEGEVNRHVAIY